MAKKRKTLKRQDSFEKREHYSSLKIEGFRQFSSIELKNLSNINLFFGSNNSGKSTMLEAVYAHACGRNFVPIFSQILARRTEGMIGGFFDQGEQIISLFNKKTSLPMKFSISGRIKKDRKVYANKVEFAPSSKLSVLDPRSFGQSIDISTDNHLIDKGDFFREKYLSTQKSEEVRHKVIQEFIGTWKVHAEGKTVDFDLYYPPSFKTPPESPFKLGTMIGLVDHRDPTRITQVFSHLKRYDILSDFSHEMKLVFPEICGIDSIPFPDGSHTPIYFISNDGTKMPTYVFGDGVRRWFLILGEIVVFRKSAVCIEEIDSSFHPSSHRSLSKKLYEYAIKYDTQLFLTSHSYEFVDEFLEGLYGDEGVVDRKIDPVRIFTLMKSDDGTQEMWEIDGKEAYEQRDKYKIGLLG